jgi:hypothetical protein
MMLSKMNNKNESIHLWMLEQDRRKNQVLAIDEEEKAKEMSTYLPNIPEYLLLGDREISVEQTKVELDANTCDIDQLIKEKKALEEESKRLDDEIGQLTLRAKSRLEEEIQDLRKKNNQKQQDLDRLKTKLSNLVV